MWYSKIKPVSRQLPTQPSFLGTGKMSPCPGTIQSARPNTIILLFSCAQCGLEFGCVSEFWTVWQRAQPSDCRIDVRLTCCTRSVPVSADSHCLPPSRGCNPLSPPASQTGLQPHTQHPALYLLWPGLGVTRDSPGRREGQTSRATLSRVWPVVGMTLRAPSLSRERPSLSSSLNISRCKHWICPSGVLYFPTCTHSCGVHYAPWCGALPVWRGCCCPHGLDGHGYRPGESPKYQEGR